MKSTKLNAKRTQRTFELAGCNNQLGLEFTPLLRKMTGEKESRKRMQKCKQLLRLPDLDRSREASRPKRPLDHPHIGPAKHTLRDLLHLILYHRCHSLHYDNPTAYPLSIY